MLSYFLLPHLVHVRTPSDGAKDKRGQVIWSPPVAIRCRIEPSTRLVRDASGEQVVASAQIFWAGKGYTPKVHFWLPGSDPADISAGKAPISIQDFDHLLTGRYSHSVAYLG